MDWSAHAQELAERVTHSGSRWQGPVARVPRHRFVPRWWRREDGSWLVHDGPADKAAWMATAYADASVITSVGPLHADHRRPGDRTEGRPTSSATLPSLVVRMFQHARIGDVHQLLDVGTGSGYGTALACTRLGDDRVTSIDVDPYLVHTAQDRLGAIGLHPAVQTVDATGSLPGLYDRIVATVAVRPVPAAWLAALRPGGRLVTTIADTTLIVTADKQPDGSALGRVEWDRAGFMPARTGTDYPTEPHTAAAADPTVDGDDITTGPYPVLDVEQAWDLASMLGLSVPGIRYGYRQDGDEHAAWLTAPDGSWARATAHGSNRPTVHQSGPQRLWDTLDRHRSYWLEHGELPARGAAVLITPDGQTRLARDTWRTRL